MNIARYANLVLLIPFWMVFSSSSVSATAWGKSDSICSKFALQNNSWGIVRNLREVWSSIPDSSWRQKQRYKRDCIRCVRRYLRRKGGGWSLVRFQCRWSLSCSIGMFWSNTRTRSEMSWSHVNHSDLTVYPPSSPLNASQYYQPAKFQRRAEAEEKQKELEELRKRINTNKTKIAKWCTGAYFYYGSRWFATTVCLWIDNDLLRTSGM